MASGVQEKPNSPLRPLQRFITAHNDVGKAVFSNAISPSAPSRASTGGAMDFMLMFTSGSFPVDMNGDKDLKSYAAHISNTPPISIPGGTVVRTVDFSPGYTSPMHRTISCDFGVVIEGEIELILDSGETRLLKPGDMAVQRGTNHAWRNTSQDKWARMTYVLQAAKPVEVSGGQLAEDEGGID